MEYQVFVKSEDSDSQYVRQVVLGTSTSLLKIATLAETLVTALGDAFYPQPEECEVGILRKLTGGYQYSTCTELDSNGKPIAIHFGEDIVQITE